jgi:hypothetical protein
MPWPKFSKCFTQRGNKTLCWGNVPKRNCESKINNHELLWNNRRIEQEPKQAKVTIPYLPLLGLKPLKKQLKLENYAKGKINKTPKTPCPA